MLAMTRAVDALGLDPEMVLVDGNRCPSGSGRRWRSSRRREEPLDRAASIVAKVTRDRIMAEHALQWPGYGWERNKGYPTPDHCRALKELGPTPLHRRSFARVREQMQLELIAAE
jgi:ribonuclease HII